MGEPTREPRITPLDEEDDGFKVVRTDEPTATASDNKDLERPNENALSE